MPAPQLRVFLQQANTESLSLTEGFDYSADSELSPKTKRASDSFESLDNR
jgi:hypothetical protein